MMLVFISLFMIFLVLINEKRWFLSLIVPLLLYRSSYSLIYKEIIYILIICLILSVIAYRDYKTYTIRNSDLSILLSIGLFQCLINLEFMPILIAFLFSIFLFYISEISNDGIGGGDLKLIATMLLIMPFSFIIESLGNALFLILFVVGIQYLYCKISKKKFKNKSIPLGVYFGITSIYLILSNL